MAEAKAQTFNIDDIEESKSIIVPNPEHKGNYAHCVAITYGRIGKEKEEGEADDRLFGITFKFVEKDTDAVLDYVCFEPTLDEDDAQDPAKVRMYTNNLSRIKQMFNSFNKEGAIVLGVKDLSFEGMYNLYMTKIDKEFSKILCKLKVVYNKKGNVTLAMVGDVISTQYKKRAFAWNPKYDFVEMKGKKADDLGGGGDDDDDDL